MSNFVLCHKSKNIFVNQQTDALDQKLQLHDSAQFWIFLAMYTIFIDR